jgi:NAD(P)-dependent dehydrogenase (short-subunit alcohol dehydrogenase family)
VSRDLEGKVILVTGANTGIGRASAVDFARRGAHVILACRSEDKTQPAIDAIRAAGGEAEFVPLDLGDLDSVRACAARINARTEPLHVLVANAGVAGHQGRTASGFEIAFGVNHIGHYLFVRLLIDKLKASAPARIVIVSSRAHYKADGIDFDAVQQATQSTTGLPEYQVSKLANVLFAMSLAERLEGTGVTTYSLHPGVIASDIWRRVPGPVRWLMKLFMKNVEDGARTQIHCATARERAGETGLYYDNSKPKTPNAVVNDAALREQLWIRSAEWVGLAP